MDCFLVKNGGAPLNFKVVGNPQPATPKENTIWVNTDVPIGKWYFDASQPDDLQEGDVWFSVGTSSLVEFNALKKNGIQVYPQGAKQYVGGALVSKDAKIYQNGAWVDWWNGELYDAGNQYEAVTGGWIPYNISAGNIVGVYPEVIYNDDFVRIDLRGDIGQFGPKNKIDLSDYDTLEVLCTVSTPLSIRVFQEIPTDINAGIVASADILAGTTSMDISGLTGKYYILINFYPSGSSMDLNYLKMR